jgi:superfamily II DNA or RNA helicase
MSFIPMSAGRIGKAKSRPGDADCEKFLEISGQTKYTLLSDETDVESMIGRVTVWVDGILKLRLSHTLRIDEIPGFFKRRLMAGLEIPNPRWVENQRFGRWNGKVPKTLRFYEASADDGLTVPRGLAGSVIVSARRQGVAVELEDRRRSLDPVGLSFFGSLKPFQKLAADTLSKKEFATLSAPTGSGKTVIALNLIASRGQSALVVVHTMELAMQWVRQIETFLKVPQRDIGFIGSGERRVGEKISVGLVQSLYGFAEQAADRIGFLLVDECHRTPSRTFTEVVSRFDSRYMLGLSATPWRRDGLSKLIFWFLGDLRFKLDPACLQQAGELLRPEVRFRKTRFHTGRDPAKDYGKIIRELISDDDRNRLIADDVAKEAGERAGTILVLSDRKQHCETLRVLLRFRHGIHAELLTGEMSRAQREQTVARLHGGDIRVLIATGQLLGEGFDCRYLSSLFLTTPIRFDGRLLQYLGRVLRPAPGKSAARVFDYVDEQVGVLKAAAEARKRCYPC